MVSNNKVIQQFYLTTVGNRTGVINLSQNGPGSNGNAEALHIPNRPS